MGQSHSNPRRDDEIRPYPQEALLIDAIAKIPAGRVLCTSAGLGQFAVAAARSNPANVVHCTYLDLYRAELARQHLSDTPSNLTIGCAADLPAIEADVVALPFSARGEAELTRDLLQSGHQRLRMGGAMFASIDNAEDIWLRDQLANMFARLRGHVVPMGTLYVGVKTESLKKIKEFACEFVFRDRERLIRAVSRPGVFSHRHIDVGARRLMDSMRIEAGMRVLDIGCGAGTVALAAACRAKGVAVHAVDSSARAVECTQRGAGLNNFANVTTELNAAGNYRGRGTYDLALANPPYYASFRIAEHFLTAGRDALRAGGRILVVTKSPEWYRENMPSWYERVTAREEKGYHLFEGARPRTA